MPESSFDKIDQEKISSRTKNRIDNFVEHFLPSDSSGVRDEKILHDSIHGTHKLKKHEIALIDMPLMQRLRQIRQAAFTYFTFPSATHSRFEHTLGTLFLSTKLASEINKTQGDYFKDLTNIRIAALMHDCGHGPFSHSSEEIYGYYDDMQELINEEGILKGVSPHEVLSALIVLSKPFKDFFDKIQEKYSVDCNYDEIANCIIGKAPKTHLYATQIINGPFDGDKLDYIYRDGKFTGLPLSIDYDRLWYATRVETIDGWRRLTVEFNGVTPIEEIIFSKMVLFSTIYHHHKVRACDCMLKGICEFVSEHPEIKINGKRIENATDFLWLTDEHIFTLFYNEDVKNKNAKKDLRKLVYNLENRRLLKRALVISRQTINEASSENFAGIIKLSEKTKKAKENLRKLAEEIWKEAGKPCLKQEIWVDLPKLPPTFEVDEIYVRCYSSQSNKKDNFVRVRDLFSMDTWAKQYGLYKWKGYVFCPEACISKVAPVAKDLIEKKYSVKLNRSSLDNCHLSESIVSAVFGK